MIEAKCPKCGSFNFDEYDSDGSVDDGQMTFKCACLESDCNCEFDFVCDVIIKSVEINED